MKQLWLALVAIMLAFAAPAFAQGALQGFVVHPMPKVVPDTHFQDKEGRTRTLADFRGKVVLLNIWATWCAPCREEMPTLDRLQAELGGPDFEVVALSIDRGGFDVIAKFFVEVGVQHLAMYLDSTTEAASTLGAVGLPISLLIDRDGTEVGRLIGPAKWDAPEMVEFIRSRLNKKSTSLGPPLDDSAGILLPSTVKGSAS
ncbi:MAG TPA: redoxin family protein [Dongiaceae bacterium]|nr:redoxin family protein [Dongiaceae bacterium]